MAKGFGSDNHCTVHPKIMEALTAANHGHMPSYGTDELTSECTKEFKRHFGKDTEVYFVFNGTAANTLSLKTLTQSYNSVFCSDTAHVYLDECGAPEIIGHCKLIPLPATEGKISAKQIQENLIRLGDQHYTQPKAVTLTQPTEMGTVYTLKEIKDIVDLCHKHNLYVHLDGARLPNACVSLDCTFKELTTDLGVDIVSFGGTKNSLMFGEAVLILNPKIGPDFKYIRKQGMQLPSKSRYVAAQFLALFKNDLWKENAAHELKLAKLLYEEIKDIKGITITQKVESNAVFVIIPKHLLKPIREKFFFYVWDEKTFECRWMVSFDNTEAEVKEFAKLIRASI
jgi:threonine aldolase